MRKHEYCLIGGGPVVESINPIYYSNVEQVSSSLWVILFPSIKYGNEDSSFESSLASYEQSSEK
jgi:hypothetical protein